MKAISVPSNWINEIGGMTVEDAISYLQTLPKDHVLDWWMEGDTHGCQVECELTFYRPYTEEEIAYIKEERKALKISQLYSSIEYHEGEASRCISADTSKLREYHLEIAEQQRNKLKEFT